MKAKHTNLVCIMQIQNLKIQFQKWNKCTHKIYKLFIGMKHILIMSSDKENILNINGIHHQNNYRHYV